MKLSPQKLEHDLCLSDLSQKVLNAITEENTDTLGQLYITIALEFPNEPLAATLLETIEYAVKTDDPKITKAITGELRDMINGSIQLAYDPERTSLAAELEEINRETKETPSIKTIMFSINHVPKKEK